MENVSKLIITVGHLANIVGKTFEDKKVDLADLVHLIPLIKEVQSLASVDFKNLGAEFKSYSPAQMAAIRDAFKAEFNIPQDQLEETVERVFSIAVMILDAYHAIKNAKA
jgi:hypothetical protein